VPSVILRGKEGGFWIFKALVLLGEAIFEELKKLLKEDIFLVLLC
jgi:hypothetical protein